MPTYIMLINLTDQGVKAVKDVPKRQQAARDMGRKFGVEWKASYMTLGAYDFVTVLEAPDDQAVAKFALATASLGNVRTTTLKSFSEPEYGELLKGL